MKSVLISVDFVYKQDGTLHPTELNTHTKDDLTHIHDLTPENFLEKFDGYFEHENLKNFMVSNSITKLQVIGNYDYDRIFRSFANFYGFEYELILVSYNSVTVPEIEDTDDTLTIRISYDAYALIDDLYARDNYEFHNLIKSESFASPVTFKENNFDTIVDFEPSQDGEIPNYVVKARTPGYIPSEFPRGYRFDNFEELTKLKESLGDDEFIAKFEFNSSLSLVDNRTHHLRTMSLVYGSNLDVLNLVYYKSLNSVSTKNELLVYDYEVDENKRMNDLLISKYYPTWFSKTGLNYHSDSTDLILKPDNTLVSFSDLKVGDEVKYIFFTEEFSGFEEQSADILKDFDFGTSTVSSFTRENRGIFINIVANHEIHGKLSWFDGIGNRYVVKKVNSPDNTVIWHKAGFMEVGDEIMVYNNNTNEIVPLTIESISFDIKDLDLYLVALTPKPEFLVRIQPENGDLYLIQHNPCSVIGCSPPGAGTCLRCNDCGKNTTNCINCGGAATVVCAI